MLVIGITGPTGCGKTTLLREIEHRGGYIVDCDALYYALLASEEGAALRQELQAAFTGNVRFTKNFFLRAVPVFLKNPVMALNYYLLGVRPYSCTYTNPGAFTVPPEMAPHIQGMEVVLGQATVPRCHCASISYGDIMEITFAGTQAETDTERDFFRFLVREGIPVRIESNR